MRGALRGALRCIQTAHFNSPNSEILTVTLHVTNHVQYYNVLQKRRVFIFFFNDGKIYIHGSMVVRIMTVLAFK